MKDSEYAKMFVEAAELRLQLKEMEDRIAKETLIRGESANIAGVKATYYKAGETTPDYENAAHEHPDFNAVDLEPYTTVTEIVRWKDVCNALGLIVRGEPREARVVVK